MPKKKILFFLFIAGVKFLYGQQPTEKTNPREFKKYIINVLEDSTNYWSDYPRPPRVTDDICICIETEMGQDDSAKFYFNRLSISQFKSHGDYLSAFDYFVKMDYNYIILGLAAHWNPDVRVSALKNIHKKLSIRPLVNSSKMKNGKLQTEDQSSIAFLMYLLENNPLFISGSENATIHEVYISYILWNLDLLTGENICEKKQFRDWYKNQKQYEASLQQWEKHRSK